MHLFLEYDSVDLNEFDEMTLVYFYYVLNFQEVFYLPKQQEQGLHHFHLVTLGQAKAAK